VKESLTKDLWEIYEPQLLECIRQATSSPAIRTRLRKCVGRAVGGIEAMCPVTLEKGLPGSGGQLIAAYGPEDRYSRVTLPVVAATPRQFLIFGFADWPAPRELPQELAVRQDGRAQVWGIIVKGIAEQAPELVANGVCFELNGVQMQMIREQAEETRRAGLVPEPQPHLAG
jgi:hypothetical protein